MKDHLKNKQRHISMKQMQKYLKGHLSSQEMYAVEIHLLSCRFCQEALEGIEMMDNEKIQEDLMNLKSQLRLKVNPGHSIKKFPGYSWIAAAVLLVIITSYFAVFEFAVFNNHQSKPELAQEPFLLPGDNDMNSKGYENIVPLTSSSAETKTDDSYNENKIEPSESENAIAKAIPSSDDFEDEPEKQNELVNEDNDGIKDAENNPDIVLKEEKSALNTHKNLLDPERNIATASQSRSMEKNAEPGLPVNFDINIRAGKDYTVKGKVTDDDGMPLPGVNVILKNSQQGTVTNTEGHFTLEMPEDKGALLFSSIGFSSKELQYNNGDSILVKLEPDVAQLSELVVVGYGEQKKVSYTTNTQARLINDDTNFKNYIKENLRYPSEALENKIEGVVVLSFFVEPSGKINQINVDKGLGYGCNEEAVRLLEEGPSWQPALKDGIPVRQKRKVRIKFKLD